MQYVPPIHALGAAYRPDMCRLSPLIFVPQNKGMPFMLYADACYGGKGMPPMGVWEALA